MKGWHYESWRHSLASKGIRTSFAPYPRYMSSVGRMIPRPSTKEELLKEEIAYTKLVLENPPLDLSEDRKKELEESLKRMESMDETKEPGYIEKQKLREEYMESYKQKKKDERAENKILNRLGNLALEGELGIIDEEVLEDLNKPGKSSNPLDYAAKRVFKKGKVHTTLSGPEVKRLASNIKNRLEPLSNKIEIAGSIRRKVDSPVDVDVVLIPKDKDKVKEIMHKLGRVTAEGSTMIETKVKGVDVDVYFAEPDTYGAQLMTRTGPWQGNIGNRTLAKNKGMLLNQNGLWKGNRKIAGRTEKQIYEALGKHYKEPELRGR